MMQGLKRHWPLALLAALGLGLIFTNLGSDYLWADEGDTAVLASTILKCGLPKAWDGVTFTDSDKGARLNDDLVMVSHPWAQYYVVAASFFAFGQNTLAARLPFALAGWMTVLLVYAFVWRISANRVAAFSAAALTLCSVQFLLYARQCRNYSLNMLLTCGLIWIFFEMKSARWCVLFAATAIVLFHSTPIGIVVVAVLGILTLIYRPLASRRRWFWLAAPAIGIFTLPWFVLARGGYAEATHGLSSIAQFSSRFVQYIIECASVTPFIGCVILLAICLTRFSRGEKGKDDCEIEKLNKDQAALLVVTFATFVCYGLLIAMTQPASIIWLLGLRYAPAVIPLVAMIAGTLISKISRDRIVYWLPLLLCFAFTKLGQLTPWLLLGERPAPNNDKTMPVSLESIATHLPFKIVDYFLNGEQLLFVRDLWHENPGTVGATCEFLREFAKPGDVLIANYEWEPLYFHTRLPQALKILPGYPVYEAARRKGLPEYVFGVDRARWIVWRPQWEDYQGYRWTDVEEQVRRQGGRLTQVAELKETYWENRENIHFRRFSGDVHIFLGISNFPPAGVFRVDWPATPSAP